MEDVKIIKRPNFFVVGVVKGGTTALYHILKAHPDIYMSPIKEVNYFSKHDIHPEYFTREYRYASYLNIEQYITSGMKHIVHIAHIHQEDHYEALFKPVINQKAIGEISNSYSVCPSSAQAIFNYNKDSKIIIMLRNPVERIWSQYIMNLREGKTRNKNFIAEIEQDLHKPHNGWGASHLYIELGMYYEQVKRFKDLFGPRLLVCFFEDYKHDPQKTIQEIYRFLEIDSSFTANLESKYNESAVPRFETLNYLLTNTGILPFFKRFFGRDIRQKFKQVLYTNKNMPVMSSNDILYIKNIYREDIQKLGVLLKRDLLNYWGY